MSQIIPLTAVPNQSLTVLLDGVRYELTVKEAAGMMAVTITRDTVRLIDSVRAVAGTPVLPYWYLQDGGGNFIFTCADTDVIPYWPDFGVSTQLVYMTPEDIADATA